MSGRGSRKRGRPPKTPNERSSTFNYQLLKKPKYLSKPCDSQLSTPSASRASSPQESDGSRSNNRKFNTKSRGRGRKSLGNVQSNTYSNRKGYESEYHYGSDFGDSTDKSDADDDLVMSASDEDSIDGGHESESEFSVCSFSQSNINKPSRPPSPDPIWLQDHNNPILNIPDSSEDLLIENKLVLKALSIYEVLRRFRHLVRLSPFRFEDFCAALVCTEQSILLSDIHIMLLKAILREEDVQGTHFGPLDQKDSVNIGLYLIDAITWPAVLRSYVESDTIFDRKVYEILCSSEYPYTDVIDRILVLQFLSDQFLTTNAVRDVMLQEGPIHYDDHCRICHRLGDLLCCETCPAVYHLECVDPPLLDVPTEDWQCSLCKSHKVVGVVDCILPQEKQGVLIRHDILGLDRHGRKFWFIARRIFVEDQSGENIWYYSTVTKFDLLLKLIDKNDLETGLYSQLIERKDEILRQLKITESITNVHKFYNKKSYIELENEVTQSLLNKLDSNDEDDNHSQLELQENKTPESKIVTRQKLNQMSNGTLYFKLGMDDSFKNYVNQYTTNPIALNKPQRNEERDKRRHLSHKFSLTTASEFKWIGITMGALENITMTLRQTLLSFEQNIASSFINPNWATIKKLWNTAVMNAQNSSDFSTVLLLFQASLKNVIFANVWNEQLGHICFSRITSGEREERKKIEKREKRERDDEEERNRLAVNYIKYSLGLKHQVWKQKGEEYRIHGQWGWMWLSSSRRCCRLRRNILRGQKINPSKINVHYTMKDNTNEIISVDPRTHKFMLQCQNAIVQGLDYNYLENYKNLKILNIERKMSDNGLINISKSLIMPGRLLYPKVARRSRLDDLLSRRETLKDFEEELAVKMEENTGTKLITSPQNTNSTSSSKQTVLERRLRRLVESQKGQGNTTNTMATVNLDLVNSLAKKIQTVRLQFSQLNRFAKQYRCYTKECNTNSNAVSQITQNTCYSPLCLQKARAKKELLLLLRKAHTAGNGSKETVAAILGAVKKPSILEQKLTEGKKDSSFMLDDIDDIKFIDESPLDLSQDWEHGRTNAVAYAQNLLLECYQLQEDVDKTNIKTELDSNKIENITINAVDGIEKMDFVDNIDVCSNVEVESSETANEDSLAALISNDDSDPTQIKKLKRNQKLRNKSYTGTKDVLNQTCEKDTSMGKQNRRFPIHQRVIKRDEVKLEKEFFENGKERKYSANSTRGRIYLLRDVSKLSESIVRAENIKTESDEGKKFTFSEFPLISNFLTHKLKKSLLVLPRYELQKLARVGGKVAVNGFHHLAKNNNIVWPYPCSRPLFKTCWSFRTCNANSLSSVALQLRVLWSCLRWDDMITKPPSLDGKHQITTETEIITLELLKLRHMGRYGERTQYLRRKTLVPLEMPKTIREVTSIRSGLRKRKRAESPQPTEPQVSEEWVEEEKLELWEIKFIGEKQEKCKLMTTRSLTLRQTDANSNLSSSPTVSSNGNSNKTLSNVKSGNEIKEKMEQQLKLQRAAHQQKRTVDSAKTNTQIKGQVIGSRRVIVKNPDGTTRIIQQAITSPAQKSNITATTISKTGTSSTLTNNSTPNQSAASNSTQQHKVQIIRGPDGKVSVRGLNPGQQLIQMPDGKLHVLTTTTSSANSQCNKGKIPIKSTNHSGSPIVKQITVKHIPKIATSSSPTVQSVQKVSLASAQSKCITPKVVAQLVNPSMNITQNAQKVNTNSVQVTQTPAIATTSKLPQNIQQLIVQSGQKLLLGQNSHGQKVIISPGQSNAATSLTTHQQTGTSVSNIQVQPSLAPTQTQQQQILTQVAGATLSNAQPTQKVIQQIVNTSNVQQQIMVGGQRIILSPGQTIVTQRSLTQNQNIQVVPQPIIQSSPQPSQSQLMVQTNQTSPMSNVQQMTAKIIKPIETQQTVLQTDQNIQTGAKTQHSNSTSVNQQIVVQNSALAQQLAQGKLQVATINGQQVIIKPLGNNQAQIVAHIKTQSDGNSHIVTNSSLDTQAANVKGSTTIMPKHQVVRSTSQVNMLTQQSTTCTSIQQQSPQQQQQQQQQLEIPQSTCQSSQQVTIEESLLQGQPPGTVIKCVTAQVIQTDQGPRIVLQGLVGNDFTQQQLALVQQQVKQQLLKAQESSGKQGVLGPTKIYLAVQPSNTVLNSQPPPLTPVHQTSQQQISSTLSKSPMQPQQLTLNKTKSITTSLTSDNIKDIKHPEKLPLLDDGSNENKTQNDSGTKSGHIKQSISKTLKQEKFNQEIGLGLQSNKNSSQTSKMTFQSVCIKPSVNTKKCKLIEDMDGNLRALKKVKSNILTTSKTSNKHDLIRTNFLSANEPMNSRIVDETLERHKDILKNNILRKRSLLERNLQNEIKTEMTTKVSNVSEKCIPQESKTSITSIGTKKLTKQMINKSNITIDNMHNKHQSHGRTRKISRKKEKLYCICRTPYDDTKFYVGCDLCSNWFHGDCVNITEEASKKLSEFICSDCKRARETQELYCSCRQPYDESQFYICCDKCQDWFHGRCVGIVQSEAEFIDEYVCPECQKNNSVNFANMKSLTSNEIIELQKLIKQVQSHKSAWPFMEPVDPKEAPDYYKVIKEPMDLQKIENKLSENNYTKLSEFIGDMTKIFDNCRYYNPKESSFYKCAETLEAYFVQKIKNFRESVVIQT